MRRSLFTPKKIREAAAIEVALQYRYDLGFDEGYEACQQEMEDEQRESDFDCTYCGISLCSDFADFFSYCPNCGKAVPNGKEA